MNTDIFDLVVIGSGPAGYTAAIKAAQLGMKVACIEKNPTLGGTCLNVGCIPSKALLHFSGAFEYAKENFAQMGIKSQLDLELETMMGKKNKIVADLCKGIEGLFIKNKVQKLAGTATIKSSNKILVEGIDNIELAAKNILIATGSQVATLPNIDIDEQKIISSTGALKLKSIPKKMLIIGAGYIGLELGSVWRRLGSEVGIVEYGSTILPSMDQEIALELYKLLQKQGLIFHMAHKVLAAQTSQGGVNLDIEDLASSTVKTLQADVALVCVGRKPFTANLGLENVGISLDQHGRINVDKHFRTDVDNIYAVGDVISGPMLAHKAEEEAVAAVEIIAGQAGHVNYNTIASVIYTNPEVASVGASEQQLKEQNIVYNVGKFPFSANSKARASLETAGFVKILADKQTDRILGAHIIGANAGNMISQLALAMEFGASSEDIARTCHPHPTLSEAVRQAAMATYSKAINF